MTRRGCGRSSPTSTRSSSTTSRPRLRSVRTTPHSMATEYSKSQGSQQPGPWQESCRNLFQDCNGTVLSSRHWHLAVLAQFFCTGNSQRLLQCPEEIIAEFVAGAVADSSACQHWLCSWITFALKEFQMDHLKESLLCYSIVENWVWCVMSIFCRERNRRQRACPRQAATRKHMHVRGSVANYS